ncbi:phage minor head protein [Methanobacterium sp.]|uniref:phage minor head protein n=1 Tax=Methanobacterium sp. TaxID=2164 RepID=UPI003C74BBE5
MKAEELHKFITAMNTKINDIIAQETGGVHFGGHVELLAAVASIEELYDLSYAPEAEAKRTGIMHIMIGAMLEGQQAEQICQTLKAKGLTEEDASKVARSEEQRIKNLADWYEYYGAGYKFFSAKSEDDACDICKEAYENGKKYPIEQLNMLPPLHGECRCDLMFHRK